MAFIIKSYEKIESSFFDPSLPELPKPIIAMVLQKITAQELSRVTIVNWRWYAFIFDCDVLFCRIIPHQCLYQAKQLALKSENGEPSTLKKVIEIEVRVNHKLAIETAQLFNQKHQSSVYGALDYRMEVIKGLAKKYPGRDAMLAFCILIALIKEIECKDQIRLEIVKVTVKKDPNFARTFADKIITPLYREQALSYLMQEPAHAEKVDVVNAAASVDDIPRAKNIAFGMPDQKDGRINNEKIDALCQVGCAALDYSKFRAK